MQRLQILGTAAGAVLMAGLALAQMPLTTIARGDASEQQTARQVTARTPAEWQAVWNAHAPQAKLPPVDFSTRMVVGVFLGTKPSDGYDVEIVNAKQEDGALVVEYIVRQPGRGVISAQILTQPYHLVSLAKQAGPVKFVQVDVPGPSRTPER